MRNGDRKQKNVTAGPSRRELVRAAALVALAGAATPMTACDVFDNDPEPPPAPDPLAPLITGALDLAGRTESAIAEFPELEARLRPVAQAHRAHAAELARITGTALPAATAGASATATPGASEGSVRATLGALRTAEQQGREAAAKACTQAPANRAALLGSITAARATHLEVLR